MKKTHIRSLLLGFALAVLTETAGADELSDWNQTMFQLALVPPATSPLVMTRVAAIVQASIFDAVNGIERRYTPVHVWPTAPRGASSRAAAVEAAYASLVHLYPGQKFALDFKLVISLAAIPTGTGGETSDSIALGREWGQKVADAIWDWRSTDGFSVTPPPFLGGSDPGQWRPTPPGLLPGAAPQYGNLVPFGASFPFQFRTDGPPALTSAQYTADFQETKTIGSLSSTVRTADQTLFSRFWAASTAPYYWNQIALTFAGQHPAALLENARLLALINIAMADAAIGCWDAKYTYSFWRPVTAIRLADVDGNPATTADPGWLPLLVTPNHQDYPSGHSCVSGAAGRVLTNLFDDKTPFTVSSDVMLGVLRSFPNISAVLEEIKNARVFAGIHFRTACNDGQTLGIGVADYVLAHSLVPLAKSH